MTTLRENYTDDDLLSSGEVAALFRVDPKTVTRWAKHGRIPDLDGDNGKTKKSVIKTPGGHMRVRYKVVRLLLDGEIELGPYGSVSATPTRERV